MRDRNSSRWADLRDATASAQGNGSEHCTSTAHVRVKRNSLRSVPICKFVHGKKVRFCKGDVILASWVCNFCWLAYGYSIDVCKIGHHSLETARFVGFLRMEAQVGERHGCGYWLQAALVTSEAILQRPWFRQAMSLWSSTI